MKLKSLLIAALSIVPFTLWADAPHVIPQPMQVAVVEGAFVIPEEFNISGFQAESAAASLQRSGIGAQASAFPSNVIIAEDANLAPEAYQLSITPGNIKIAATDRAGVLYAIETLKQIISQSEEELQAMEILDSPRMEYRGMMLDVVRCYLPMAEIKKIVDVLASLKINKLHLHLTDDNGWRMEVKKYPKLTEVGAWRVDRPEMFAARANAKEGEPATYGGYYTQDELRDLVAYAAEREIEVIPEIEMPAHSVAAIASYPELACPVYDGFIGVLPGLGGKAASIIMCAGRDSTLTFVTDVLDEVMEIFPSKYIHLGGDEANKSHWEKCQKCNQRIIDENLAGYEELQAWFMDSINSYVRHHGRTAIGWDEVTYGKPKEDMVIMGWQGDGSIAVNYARETGRRFIMTPAKSTYFIRYQGPQWFEPFTYFGNITLKDVYDFDPVKPDWTPEMAQQLWGIQGSMWTEFCRKPSDVQRQIFPRMFALADAAWRQPGESDWPGFIAGVDNFVKGLDAQGIEWAKSMYNVQHTAYPNGDGTVTLTAECIRPDVQIMVDGLQDKVYGEAITISEPATIGFQAVDESGAHGQPLYLNFDFNKATGRNVTSDNCNNNLQRVMTNGLRGSFRNSDFEWAGWQNRDAEFVIDLGSVQNVGSVTLGILTNANMMAALPPEISISLAENEGDFKLARTVKTDASRRFPLSPAVVDVTVDWTAKPARFIKVQAKNAGPIPDGYPREGSKSWIYIDEVNVK